MRQGLAYGLLASRRRLREMVLPAVTTATGAFLVVVVLALAGGIQRASASLGHSAEVDRAVVLIAVVVLLVGVVEVAVATTRTVHHRTRELGVLGATGVPRRPVVAALMVEPVVSAVTGALAGAALAVVCAVVWSGTGLSSSDVSVAGCARGVVLAVVVSTVAAVATSIVPTWRAASRPPIHSLASGG